MNDRLLRALRREPVDRTPVWFMRQAGRSLPRYREARQDTDILRVMQDPEASAEITVMPLDYYPVDALIIFNDLCTPFLGAGLDVVIKRGVGPVVADPIVGKEDVARLQPFDPVATMDYTMQAIRRVCRRVEIPVLGFVGAPFTLCSYLLESPRTRNFEGTKRFMWTEPVAWRQLMEYWAEHLAAYAIGQYRAGAAAIQVFDSWAGVLAPEDYTAKVAPHSSRLLELLREAGVPTIHFFTGNPRLLPLVAAAGGDCISVDWRVPIDEAWEVITPQRAIQGNLDPTVLLAGEAPALEKTREILWRVRSRPGHIFNLGHGILPQTDPAVVRAVVDMVHESAPLYRREYR